MFTAIRRWFKRPQNPAGHVYYARLKTPSGTYYKVGFTTKSTLTERMAYGGHGDEMLIDREFLFTYRTDAWDVEQTLLEHFAKHRAFRKFSNDPMKPLNGRGQSELFAHDILGLDDDLYRLSEQDKQAIQRELQQANEGCVLVLLGLVLAFFTFGLSLLFIGAGASGVLADGTGTRQAVKRPRHPPKIQELLDALIQPEHSRSNAA